MEKTLSLVEKTNYLPHPSNVFNCFSLPFDKVKVVILGQDPYHTKGMAHGYAFSVLPTHKGRTPPSLANIRKVVESTTQSKMTKDDLRAWVERGVLLLNTCLTVEEGKAGSHSEKMGWESLTFSVLKALQAKGGVHFVFLGNHAKEFFACADIDNSFDHLLEEKPYNKRYTLEGETLFLANNNFGYLTTHPSPYSFKNGFSNTLLFFHIANSFNKNFWST